MNKSKELAKNTLILAAGKISTQLITFLLLPLYTTYLSPSDYGIVDLVITYSLLVSPIISLQLETAAFRFLVDARSDDIEKSRVITNVLQIVLSIVLAISFIGLAVNQLIHLRYATLILLNICATVFLNVIIQFARGLGKNIHYAVATIIIGVTNITANVLLIVVFRLGATGMLTSVLLANTISTIYLFFALKLYKYISPSKHAMPLKKALVHYSAPMIPNGVSLWAIDASDRTIVSVVIGLAANGIYAIANKFSIIFNGLFLIFSIAWAESVAVHINDEDSEGFISETMNASIKFFGSLGLLMIAFLPFLFDSFVGVRYHEAYQYIPILLVGAFCSSIVVLYSGIYIAKKLTRQVANTSVVAAVINIILTLSLVKFIGVYGAAIATAVAYLVMAVYRHYDIKKYVTITFENGLFVKMVVLYAGAITLYYYNNVIGNIANVIITTGIVIIINKSMLKTLHLILRSKLPTRMGDRA